MQERHSAGDRRCEEGARGVVGDRRPEQVAVVEGDAAAEGLAGLAKAERLDRAAAEGLAQDERGADAVDVVVREVDVRVVDGEVQGPDVLEALDRIDVAARIAVVAAGSEEGNERDATHASRYSVAMASAKAMLKAELIKHLEEELEKARTSHAAAAAAATDDEARPENDKDTRGLEQSYLARGHAMRVAELETAIVELNVFEARAYTDDDEIAIGALVTVTDEDEDEDRQIWIVPHGGGIALGKGVTAVAPTSPLGGKLVGKTVDDELEVVRAGSKRTLTITAIR